MTAATASVVGGVKQTATQANSTATDVAGLVTDFNALLAKLKAAGIMA
ncbi:head fiber protein [Serratia marcescens]|nr:head fiber protein [Serratia marcescens]